jgi:hypothetical protein
MADSVWYAWEHELAFDKDIYDQNPYSLLLILGYSMLKKELLTINDQPLNKLRAKVRFSGSNYRFTPYYTGDISIVLYGNNDFDRISDVFSTSDRTTLTQIFHQQRFNTMLNGNINYNSLGELLWNAKIEFATQPNGVGLAGYSTAISGTDNSDVRGLGPFYTNALGVFYLNAKPEVNYTQHSADTYEYTLDASSVQYIFNPYVLEVATIENIKQDLIATQDPELFDLEGRKELFIGQKLTSDMPLSIQGVRVSFDVVPKDGGNKIHIAKMFMADIVL